MEVNVKDLIAEVQKRPVLWNRSTKNYHNRYVIEKQWQKIELKLGIPKECLKKKWKTTRDQYRNECKRIQVANEEEVGAPGDFNKTYSSWPPFNSLHFLKDQMRTRFNVNEVLSSPTYCTSEPSVNGDPMEDIIIEEVEEPCDSSNKDTAKSDIAAELLAIEQRKLLLLEERFKTIQKERDDDESFFDSLLPYVRRMGIGQKLRCRMEIQEIVYSFSIGENATHGSPIIM